MGLPLRRVIGRQVRVSHCQREEALHFPGGLEMELDFPFLGSVRQAGICQAMIGIVERMDDREWRTWRGNDAQRLTNYLDRSVIEIERERWPAVRLSRR